MSKYLYAVALIVSVAGCQSSAKAGGGAPPPSADASPSITSPSAASPSPPLLPPAGTLTRVAELSYSGGFAVRGDLAVPAVVVYSDGTVVFNGQKRLTFTPGALDVLVSTLQKDLAGQPTKTVLQPNGGHPIPDVATTVLGVYQPGGTYQTVSALGLAAGNASRFPAPVADAFAKLQALTSDATTPYTTTKVRYAVTCPSGAGGPEQPWPKALPQPGTGQPNTCLELRTIDGPAADAVRAACTDVNTRQPQPATIVYRTDSGPRICRWRSALPDETS
ncbi:hypothetical protein [Catenulispora sp. GP43]|uniref:hypothetical protein n=1 Tax=Catenulispora sp. GP43 TaxID=3156263 RepID=UPI0035190BA8